MKSTDSELTLRAASLAALALALRLSAPAAAAEPAVAKTKWREFEAYRMSDGRSEAVVVPQLGGRLVHYGLIGGTNWIWTGEPGSERKEPPLMWGGDKTYIGPHTMWKFTQSKVWPPPPPDFAPHEVQLEPEGAASAEPRVLLRTTSTSWPGYGARVSREYHFEANGDFVTRHSISAVADNPTLAAVWVITQTIPTEFVFVPLNPKTPYEDGVYWFGFGSPKDQVGATVLSPSLLQIRPVAGTGYKLGAHPAKPALAAVHRGEAFLQRADPQEGQYPEGADEAGLSVEVYHHHLPPPGQYTELELLSPLRRLDQGATLTTRWNVHPVKAGSERESIEQLFGLNGG